MKWTAYKVRGALLAKGYTLADVARLKGVHKVSVSDYVNGEITSSPLASLISGLIGSKLPPRMPSKPKKRQ